MMILFFIDISNISKSLASNTESSDCSRYLKQRKSLESSGGGGVTVTGERGEEKADWCWSGGRWTPPGRGRDRRGGRGWYLRRRGRTTVLRNLIHMMPGIRRTQQGLLDRWLGIFKSKFHH